MILNSTLQGFLDHGQNGAARQAIRCSRRCSPVLTGPSRLWSQRNEHGTGASDTSVLSYIRGLLVRLRAGGDEPLYDLSSRRDQWFPLQTQDAVEPRKYLQHDIDILLADEQG